MKDTRGYYRFSTYSQMISAGRKEICVLYAYSGESFKLFATICYKSTIFHS